MIAVGCVLLLKNRSRGSQYARMGIIIIAMAAISVAFVEAILLAALCTRTGRAKYHAEPITI